MCMCVRMCVTCPLFREARKTLAGRWTAAYKVPVPPIRKDSKILKASNGTVAQIYVCTLGTEIEAAPNTHTFAIVSEFRSTRFTFGTSVHKLLGSRIFGSFPHA